MGIYEVSVVKFVHLNMASFDENTSEDFLEVFITKILAYLTR